MSVKVNVCVMVPLVAVTVMTWFATTGVPGLVGPVLPPPPPPHAAIPINRVNISMAPTRVQRRRRDSIASAMRAAHRSRMRIAPAVVRHPPKSMWRLAGKSELGAVVETLIVEVPPAATVAGVKLHVLSEGRLEQPVRLTDAVKPFIAFTVTTVDPDEPGALTLTVGGANEILKSGPGVTFSEKLAEEFS